MGWSWNVGEDSITRWQSKNAGNDQAMQQIEVTPTPRYGGGVIGACHNVVPSIQCHDGRAATT